MNFRIAPSVLAATRLAALGGVVGLASTIAFAASAADVDWKVYGFASVAGTEVCFYEAMGVDRTPDRHLRVWTKCLSQKDMEAVDIKNDFGGKILENATRKMYGRSPYMPPIARVESIDFDQATIVTVFEETANISYIRPHSTIFYELNCPQKMLRELSLSIEVNGQHGSRDTPSEWRFIPPEGNWASLLKILCS
jgi:hypothetical protein